MSKQNVTSIKPTKPFVYERPIQTAFAKDLAKTPVSTEILLDILRRPRFADSEGELYVIEKYIKTLPGVLQDKFGNFWLEILQADGSAPTTLFSAHTDTVHKAKATGTYTLAAAGGMLSVKGGGVLGADDGTGIWIMLNLIEAKVPGLYIFHREEEIGGNGSSHIAAQHAEVLDKYNRAIAFDRKGTRDIITHQGGERCCSDAFAEAFAEQLNLGTGFQFRGDDTGSFTDTKNYTSLISECTNLAVGYYDQHTTHETQDLTFVTRLVQRMVAIDWEALPTERDKTVVEDQWSLWDSYRTGGGYNALRPNSRWLDNACDEISAEARELADMVDIVKSNPDEIAKLLQELGFDAYELEQNLGY